MTPYLDASVIVPYLVNEQSTPIIQVYFDMQTKRMWLSEVGAAEVSSAISRLVRMKEMSPEKAFSVLSDFDAWRGVWTTLADLLPVDVQRAHAYVRRFELKLRTPDAIHLAIAQRLGATLVTLDDRLADAARALGLSYERL